jgi:hypothetical protein
MKTGHHRMAQACVESNAQGYRRRATANRISTLSWPKEIDYYPMSSLKFSMYSRTATLNLSRFAGVSEAALQAKS